MVKEHSSKFEDHPLTRPEYISAMVHLYRGELYRAQVWRLRLDATTNWAVLSVGAIMSFAFGSTAAENAHMVIILGMYMVMTMLVFEARRYRFYDVWRNRVRRIEENFYVPILRRDLTSPMENWGYYVAEDMLNPSYKITFLMAMKARLMNNYLPFFMVLLAAWIIKVEGHQLIAGGKGHMSIGEVYDLLERDSGLPGWVPIAGVGGLYCFIFYVYLFVKPGRRPEDVYFGVSRIDSIDDVG